jgi:hypothetical protein
VPEVTATILISKDMVKGKTFEQLLDEVKPIRAALYKSGADVVTCSQAVRPSERPEADEDEATFMARGRASDCDCQLITCVCTEARAHDKTCRHRVALTCAVPIVCEHGYDTCPECDPCTCSQEVTP